MHDSLRLDLGVERTIPICPICQSTVSLKSRYCIKCKKVTTTFNKRITVTKLNGALISSRDTLSGCVLNGKYQLIRRLGEGGTGAVYLAHRLHVGDKVAVKVLNQQNTLNPVSVKRFRREGSIAAKSRDPRVVKIYDSGETPDGIIYLVMEFIIAPTMRVVLEREGRFSPERAVALIIEICAGVDAAHREGIVHRDLKPENILIVPPTAARDHESVVIVDFGIAKLLDLTTEQILTEPGVILGTLFYMPPEQLKGVDVDVRADIYSLGAVLYEMITGKPPFTGLSVAEVIAKHILEEPNPLPAHLNIKPALELVVMRALSKDPNQRYANVNEMVSALHTSLQSSSMTPRRKRWLNVLTQFSSFF